MRNEIEANNEEKHIFTMLVDNQPGVLFAGSAFIGLLGEDFPPNLFIFVIFRQSIF